eukprot:CAMPEP_0197316158 /NCGR_PEP_ID=MMETSP0891-20130614/41349_1 /TAXON_ID=44058 ORGANISM="Aureoumbra lagunensis, Strain CCMP1510" /NCGR_SAMPLE_ID=MMETSP0891 /ASSEMBLY_ACC=CAM_ASM_000534 /LENGTH=414 /DNA_ID=CAMNT_0042805499 /DNA_START=96 /DNA_END=1340 /DNA_ORIENTATION=-
MRRVFNKKNIVEEYFEAWNERDMDKACNLFTDDCKYEDTLYPGVFEGKIALRKHLVRVADALPENFVFVVDELADSGAQIGVRWHLENGQGKNLPFARGASMYKIKNGKIVQGFDVPEPAPFKTGDISLTLLSIASRLIAEPIRIVPLACFFLYCQQLFIAQGQFLPGPNALSLDPATWDEVFKLSLNFWFVGPLLVPSAFPSLNPVLEGVFNLVLVWSALFFCFAADGRSPRDTGFLRTCIGMQFLTNAFFLPYLATRPPEDTSKAADTKNLPITTSKLNKVELFFETNPFFPLLLCTIGIASIAWAAFARPEYGTDLLTRYNSFSTEILAKDRLGSSFIVDLLLYALFQSWLVPDDLKRRRGVDIDDSMSDRTVLRALAAIPFFGLVAYLVFRPPLLNDDDESLSSSMTNPN